MGALQQRITEKLEEIGLSEAEFARRIGMSQQATNIFLNGDASRWKYSVTAAKVLGVTAEWLEIGMEISGGNNRGILSTGVVEFGKDEFASLPRYDARFSAGNGSLIDPNAEPIGYQLIEQQWLRSVTNAAPEHLAVVKVDGDSMETTLSDGDWVLLDRTQKRITREGIYALAVHDSCWIKRVSLNLREKLVRVISDNDRYPVQELPEDELTLIGRVLSVVWRKT